MAAHGSLSTLGKLQTLLRNTDLNVTRLAALADAFKIEGAGETSLSRALNGGKPLGSETEKGLGILVKKLETLIALAAPIEVRFQNTEKIKKLLDSISEGKLYLLVVDAIENGVEPEQRNGPEQL